MAIQTTPRGYPYPDGNEEFAPNTHIEGLAETVSDDVTKHTVVSNYSGAFVGAPWDGVSQRREETWIASITADSGGNAYLTIPNGAFAHGVLSVVVESIDQGYNGRHSIMRNVSTLSTIAVRSWNNTGGAYAGAFSVVLLRVVGW